jgi:hypothetical protein
MVSPRPSPAERARRILAQATNMTLATVSAAGAPWISPLFFTADEAHDLYWTSEPSARHSVNVRETGAGAVVVVCERPGEPVDAVYMRVRCVELAAASEVMASKAQPERWRIGDLAQVSPGGPWRIYRAHPETVEVRMTAERDGSPVARRTPADFRVPAEADR